MMKIFHPPPGDVKNAKKRGLVGLPCVYACRAVMLAAVIHRLENMRQAILLIQTIL
jgi:hypothetical protein